MCKKKKRKEKEVVSLSLAETLLSMFSRAGILWEIYSDQGTQFASQLMGQLLKPFFTIPSHSSANSRVERLHVPLKAFLNNLCDDKPREWHRYLFPVLFILREIQGDSYMVSTFELLRGRAVRGPLSSVAKDRTLQDDKRLAFKYRSARHAGWSSKDCCPECRQKHHKMQDILWRQVPRPSVLALVRST